MTRKEERRQASIEYHTKPHYEAIKDDFLRGAEWADETMIDKVCNWLEENMCFTTGIAHGIVGYQCAAMECFINDLRKAMEE